MSTTTGVLATAKNGFKKLSVGAEHQEHALDHLSRWLTDEQFADYLPQIEHMIEEGYWDYLLDSFHQIIPFGTGGRRGEVGIGPNRINPWTIKSSAQGHSQYLHAQHGEAAKERGLVLAYDVRQFFTNRYFNDALPNPVKNLNCKDLAFAAAGVYVANGIKVYLFDDIRTTPELSFAIRHLGAVGGDMFSASHNPPEHNGKKVYDEFGGQLIPPQDEELVKEVTQNVTQIKTLSLADAEKQGLLLTIGPDVDEAYIEAGASLSLSNARDVKVAYTPLHGCGSTSVEKVLKRLGFHVESDPQTSTPSGKFENVTFNIPNPEVVESFETPLKFARSIGADILLSSDPDADRIGVMVSHGDDWVFLNGNEIAAILADYVITKSATTRGASNLDSPGIIIKTAVTTDLIRQICEKKGVHLIGDLLVGYKYIADEMNTLEKEGKIDAFLFGCEESHGYNAGNYARDKDAVVAAVWLAELAAELRAQGKTLVDDLNRIYSDYGFFRSYLTEIRSPGAEGGARINAVQASLRDRPPEAFGRFTVTSVDDYRTHEPIVSNTDFVSKNVLRFHFEPVSGTTSIMVTVRPSGTEPKIKMYFQIGSEPFAPEKLEATKEEIESLREELERAFMNECYRAINVDFPERGYLLFWQLPLDAKLKYFEIEASIAALKDETDAKARRERLFESLEFLGSDPIEKIDRAFAARYEDGVLSYLGLKGSS